MKKKRYVPRLQKITVRACDDPSEYARQYYWVVKKGKSKAPPKQRKRKTKRITKKR